MNSALFGLVSSYKWPPVRFAKVPGSKFVGLPDYQAAPFSCHSLPSVESQGYHEVKEQQEMTFLGGAKVQTPQVVALGMTLLSKP